MPYLTLSDVDVSVRDASLFHIDHVTLSAGDRIGLIGANAGGKTTLLRLIMGELPVPRGSHLRRTGLWSYFRQLSPDVPETPDPEQISRWDLYDVAWRTDGPVSGGEQVRLRLAEHFHAPHDVLILDEPTAHLDADGRRTLGHLLAAEPTYLLVSHDRALLNAHCSRLWVIAEGELIDFPGTYDAWKAYEAERFRSRLHAYENAVAEKARLEGVLDAQRQKAQTVARAPRGMSSSETKQRAYGTVGKSFGGKAKRLSQTAKHTEKRLERLGTPERPRAQPVIRPDFHLTDPPRNPILVEIEHLTFAYPGAEPLFKDAAFTLPRATRVALTGPNGSGKSTLLRLIHEGHPAIRTVPKATFGYFDQSYQAIDRELSVLGNLRRDSVQDETVNRNILARMGFGPAVLGTPARVLSGGELTKLCFAKLFVSDANVLLIDEPGNYLDIPSLEAIERLFLDFEGSMIICSHDRYFLDTVADTRWEIREHTLVHCPEVPR